VEKFKVFMKLLSEGKNKEQAILEAFGNKRIEEKEQEKEQLIEIVNVQNNLIKNLTKKQKELIKQVYFLQREIEAFNTRLETLENKGFKRIFKK
uniref:hypothetical protein n=1 Tax=Enterococcus faecalis TaxID=1351 RepID=UPI004042C13D